MGEGGDLILIDGSAECLRWGWVPSGKRANGLDLSVHAYGKNIVPNLNRYYTATLPSYKPMLNFIFFQCEILMV